MSTHAKLSPSSAHRWMRCPGSVQQSEGIPDTSSSYAEEGTRAHAIAQNALDVFVETGSLAIIDQAYCDNICPPDDDNPPIDPGYVEEYCLYVLGYCTKGAHLLVEQKVDYNDLVEDGFGTADAIVVRKGIMHVIDLKFGKGLRVDADENEQAQLYAYGALREVACIFPNIRKVVCHIHQPRLNHVSTWETTPAKLKKFGQKVKAAAELAKSQEPPFKAGPKQCQWCKAKAICPAMRAQALENAKLAFENVAPKEVGTITLASDAMTFGVIKAWMSAVEKHLSELLLSGNEVPGWKMVEGRSVRKWVDSIEEELPLVLGDAAFQAPKVQTITKAAKMAKAIGKLDYLAALITKPEGKPTMVPEGDKRPALNFGPEAAFDVYEEAA